ncbi:MAG: c-type cytochrome [Candidatus Eremiobacteraeota bacterium]|nr:c-type cytochrome [Candidatus Eremiobacteraeota bacterium]
MRSRFFQPLAIVGAVVALAISSTHFGASAAQGMSAEANGRSIFLTGKDDRGSKIVARKPPLYASCAACHRANGSGGVHLPGGAVSADLRHAALVTHQKHPYDLTLLERAISTGIDNEGKPLDPVMPHWRLSRRDLHDVALYVLTKVR